MIQKKLKSKVSIIENFCEKNLSLLKGVGKKTALKFSNQGYDKVIFIKNI